MPKATGLAIYSDVQEVADMVLAHRGGDYECSTYGQARHFQQRFYKFRQLYRKTHGEPCPYDAIIIKHFVDPDSVVRFRMRQHVGTFRPVGASVVDSFENDELFALATKIARQIGEDE